AVLPAWRPGALDRADDDGAAAQEGPPVAPAGRRRLPLRDADGAGRRRPARGRIVRRSHARRLGDTVRHVPLRSPPGVRHGAGRTRGAGRASPGPEEVVVMSSGVIETIVDQLAWASTRIAPLAAAAWLLCRPCPARARAPRHTTTC